MIELIPAPAPGFYYGIPAKTYFAWDAVNCSALKKIIDCPANYEYSLRFPKPVTPALLQGSVTHTAILEPLELEKRYVVAGECCATKGSGGKCTNNGKVLSGGYWYCGVHGKNVEPDPMEAVLTDDGELVECPVITQDMMDTALAMQISVKKDRAARGLLVGALKEVCIVWVDPETGLLCKGRMDAYREEERKIPDLKTCECSSPDEFSRAIADHAYDMQAAFYLDGASIASGGILHDEFYFIAVAKSEARVCACYKVHKNLVDLGRYRYRKALADMKWCKENNFWPGYHDHQIEPINVPRWFFDKESKL